jgi:Dullard-like phosphatase family protein
MHKYQDSTSISNSEPRIPRNLTLATLSCKDKVLYRTRVVKNRISCKSSSNLVNSDRKEKNQFKYLKNFYGLNMPSKASIKELSELILHIPIEIDYFNKTLNLIKRIGYEQRKTLVLDLDETLTHTNIKNTEGHVTLSITHKTDISVNIRPFAQDLLKYASQDFEVIIFTASQSKYANTILNHLDPMNKYIHHRLYRDQCYLFNGYYLKDLRILGRDIRDIVFVDNSLISFALQIENGVPVTTWTEDLNDTQLKVLIDYLKIARNARDVRNLNKDIFDLKASVSEMMKKLINK